MTSTFIARTSRIARMFSLTLMLASSVLSASAFAADKPTTHGAGMQGAEKVNLNTADAATIDRVLLNVGPSKAQAIVDYRKEHGAFKSPEQLALVKGIGLKTVEKNRDRIVVGGSAVPARPAVAPITRR
jgi:competence protein ComEA